MSTTEVNMSNFSQIVNVLDFNFQGLNFIIFSFVISQKRLNLETHFCARLNVDVKKSSIRKLLLLLFVPSLVRHDRDQSLGHLVTDQSLGNLVTDVLQRQLQGKTFRVVQVFS